MSKEKLKNCMFYRLLNDDEVLCHGDQYWFNGKWKNINSDTIGMSVPLSEFPCPYRRNTSIQSSIKGLIEKYKWVRNQISKDILADISKLI
jgi:hypothetical protein